MFAQEVTIQQEVLSQIQKNNPSLDQAYAEKLAQVIVEKSIKFRIPANVFTAILMQESGYNVAAKAVKCGFVNETSEEKKCVITDFGISQIHHKNISRFKFDRKKLLSNLEYSVDAGAKVLSTYTRYSHKEPKTWFCRYNTGTRSFKKIKENCLEYKHKVDRYL